MGWAAVTIADGNQWHGDQNSGAFVRRRLYGEAAIHQMRSLLHADQPQPFFPCTFSRSKPAPVSLMSSRISF